MACEHSSANIDRPSSPGRHRLFLSGFAIYLMFVACSTLLYIWKGHDIIASRYGNDARTESAEVEQGDSRSVEYYSHRAESVLTGFWLLGAVIPVIYGLATKGYWLTALLTGDLVCLALSALIKGPFSIERDLSIPEFYQYAKELAVAWILFACYRALRYPTLLCLTLIFVFFLIDDSLQYHERVGLWISHAWPALGDSAAESHPHKSNSGEALALLAPAVTLGLLLLFAYLRDNADARSYCRIFLGLIFLLAVFGVFIDLILKPWSSQTYRPLLTVAEDGGEMIIMSLMLYYAIHLRKRLFGDTGRAPSG